MTKPVCAIVGAGEGLGRALAAKFASREFDIALISRSEVNSSAAIEAAAATASAANVRFFSADATRPETLESAIATINRAMGEIDLLIYNARGAFTACDPLDMSYAALEDVYRVEVIGAFAAAKSVLPGMIRRSRGSVFFSSATAAFRGSNTREFQTRLRSRCPDHARPLWRRIRSSETGQSRRCRRDILADLPATEIRLEQ
jgi:NAD(P)-dependent dehydrogenase (short-subunit alcohol dehydrogenase family)